MTVTAAEPAIVQPASSDPFRVGMIVFDRMTNLDFAGPADVFARVPGASVHVIAHSHGAIVTDAGIHVVPDVALDDAPELDLIFIGGGPGTTELMEDGTLLAFLAARAERAAWITSVCTGALVLGAAGLLRGYRATSHWTTLHILALLGADAVEERVVIDRNRITGGGVTAGIDFALTVVAALWGDELAQTIQLGMEYDPAPPFNAGSPQTAPAHIVERFLARSAALTDARVAAATRAAARFR
jgi:cyclohexyl-isocyanide hydratase